MTDAALAFAPEAASSYPLTVSDDDPREYDANGHYLIGPKLAQPHHLVAMIAEARVDEPPDEARRAAESAIAAKRRAYRQSLTPIRALAAAIRGARC